jgi:mevalonate kinase
MKASAPAKIILFAEHFVVFGEPAVVLTIDKRVSVQVKLRQDKDIYVQSLELELSRRSRKEKFESRNRQPRKSGKGIGASRVCCQEIKRGSSN